MNREMVSEVIARQSQEARETLQGIMDLFDNIESDSIAHVLIICLGDIASAFMKDFARLTMNSKRKISGDIVVSLLINNLDAYAKHLLEQISEHDKPRH